MKSFEFEAVTTADAARVLGVTPEGVRYLARKGQLAMRKLGPKAFVFDRAEVQALARRRGAAGPLSPSVVQGSDSRRAHRG